MICSSFNSDASENIAYNNPLFPAYIRHGALSSYPDYSAFSHWHDDLEFILIHSGNMTYNINGELLALTEGNGVLVNSRQLHYGFSNTRQECSFTCFILSPELLHANDWFYHTHIEPSLRSASAYLYLDQTQKWTKRILDLLSQLAELDFSNASSYFTIQEYFWSIYKIIYQNITHFQASDRPISSDLLCVKQMIIYLKQHYTNKITLEELARSGTCCKSKCSKLFQTYLQETPMEYLTKYRLHQSLDHLLNSDDSITDIAAHNGFCSTSYYCELFKRYYNTSPVTYRKLHQSD